MSRLATNKLLELIEEGVLDKDAVISGCLNYMSEDDVNDMFRSEFEELYEENFGDDEDDEDDGQPDEAQEWHDFDPDC
tara:strand:+ start:67 stop:300 length:234 start_codon:yes stop_codon:yes gene_type:complete